ncbi:ATP-binding protein [Rhodoblastus sp.]|uniref:ATP-binding protein n=1 Tax=Rhodoblastus sp. TaxID=1962975 RepID=UPI00262A90B5|nr:ATP-binding protein [Rhodoblastus sp.]
MRDDPFKPLEGGKKPGLHVVSESSEWAIVTPIPADSPAPPAKHPALGAPSARWTYKDSTGLLGYILRFDPPSGKEFRPLALWRPASGGAPVWRWQAWPEPRPLYRLDRLAARPSAPVVLCEGEKAADAAARLLPDHVCIASPNGSRAARKADWTPLAGRQVVIWPDADEAGQKYSHEAALCLAEAGAASVSLIAPPADATAGWDAADALADGWTPAQAEALIRAARPFKPPAAQGRGARSSRSPDDDAPKMRGVEAIIRMVDNADISFWHDTAKNAYATFEIKGHRENHRITSKDFGRWVAAMAHAQGLTPPSSTTLNDALRVFEARAINDGPLRAPFKRVGERDGRWYIDPGFDDWSAIEITPEGWTPLAQHDLPMIRSPAMRAMPPLPRLDQAPSIDILRPFVNADDAAFPLVVSWLIAALWPRGPYPILILQGEQGTAKSSLTRLLRQIVDPNAAPLRTMPKDEMDLLVSATHSHVLALDNLSRLSAEASDLMCGIATGTGSSARAKFTDGDEFIVATKNPIILNGITALANRPDLASRALVVQLQPIGDDARKSEQEYEAEWSEVAPRVLAALLDVMVCAIGNLPSTKMARSSRLADFERLIEAAAPALGWEPGEFGEIYRRNQEELDSVTIEADDMAASIVSLIEDDPPHRWTGTPSALLDALGPKVSESVRRSKSWPQNATALGNRLARLAPVLRRRGIIIDRRHSGERRITITQAAKP